MEPLEAGPKILLVDDEIKICTTLKKVLETAGYSVEVAYNAKDGWVCLEQFEPDCVILDLRMPGGNGYELLLRIKSNPHPPHVIIATAVATETLMQMCIKAGAAHFLIKPIHIQKLLARIEALLHPDPPLSDSSTISPQPHGNH